ncbi:MAG: sugar ABC transporter permease [Chloroflexi bacterium]|nr:sugar ABC transporter permease [Chloroflexota bacterium]
MATPVALEVSPSRAGARMSRARRREALAGYLLLLPWAIGFLLFVAGPLVASAALSFTAFDVARPPRFVGLENYVNAFTSDDRFLSSLQLTFVYAVVSVPLALFGSLLLALLLNQRLRGTSLYRTFFFLPSLTPAVAVAILWTWLLQPDVGLVNYLLSLVGITGPKWLGSTEWAMPSLIVIALWTGIGGNRMMIFLAGLQGVPQELYDAADIDGAGAVQKFRHITLPMISPTMFFNLVLGIIAALKVFTVAFIATQGGPAFSTWFIALHIWSQAFKYLEMGYASALAWIFTLILLLLTVAQFRLSRHWVYYEGEDSR